MIRVLVVDDHPVVRQGLIAVLEDEPDMSVVGWAASATGLVDLLPQLKPDVLLLDLEMPGEDGIEAIGRMVRAGLKPKVVVFTAYDAEERVLEALQAGALGYLLKGASSAEIVLAIQTVNSGRVYIEPRLANQALSSLRTPRQAAMLTPRELEVLGCIVEGHNTKEIAAGLGITERTVKFHVSSVLNKLGADNRARAVAIAMELKLIKPVRKDR